MREKGQKRETYAYREGKGKLEKSRTTYGMYHVQCKMKDKEKLLVSVISIFFSHVEMTQGERERLKERTRTHGVSGFDGTDTKDPAKYCEGRKD